MVKSSKYDKPKETTDEHKTSVGLHVPEKPEILLHYFRTCLFPSVA